MPKTDVWYMETPTLRALSKLINLYYYFKIGYDNRLADDLSQYILTDEEMKSLQELLRKED